MNEDKTQKDVCELLSEFIYFNGIGMAMVATFTDMFSKQFALDKSQKCFVRMALTNYALMRRCGLAIPRYIRDLTSLIICIITKNLDSTEEALKRMQPR